MAQKMREWRKRKRELDELLCCSDSEDEDESIETAVVDSGGSQPTASESVPETSFDLDSDVACLSTTDSEYGDDDYEEEEEAFEGGISSFEVDLRQWATEHKVTHRALNGLLSILRREGHHLPVDCRTLLATPHQKTTESKCGGNYKYYGLEEGIRGFLSLMDSNDVHLTVNIDGIPLFKSSGLQFWPILVKCGRFDPVIVAMFCGKGKPSPLDDFLDDFLKEYKSIKDNGVLYEGQTYNINIDALICDAPARAYLKCIKGHASYESCERCAVQGTRVERRMVFGDQEATLRTDDGFARMQYRNHQTDLSPLIAAGIPGVSSFVLDYMHMVCLGVVRRMLVYLTRGPKICRLSARQKDAVSQKQIGLRGKMPSEFARQPRGLQEMDRWKATEFRQFLLYTGPVVLKSVMSPERYKHFLSLSVAMSILLESDDKIRNAYLQYARDLIKHFITCCDLLYGKTFSVYNVHGLSHLHEDASHFNCSLNDISCFPFENYLQQVKKDVRSGRNPLEQVTRRLTEREHSAVKNHKTRPQVFISAKERDSCFLLENDRFAFVQRKNADGTLACKILHQRHTSPLFHQPCSSALLNVVCIGSGHVTMKNCLLREEDLFRKVAFLPQECGGAVLIPLRHGPEKAN
ncbi:uncharacterized protein si:dkey-242h9.3 isoform X6 [Engraulis encrasicolus]|uniref:uncharacterized protein si:dkey-242h9.3 isoform X6 n=1 Tax=Engraulis encrasicolus TaxID=184585 RepID=UPI002FD4BF31